MKEVNKKPYWALIAPDGEIQLGIMAEGKKTCKDVVDFMAAKGVCLQWDALIAKGYALKRVELTVTELSKKEAES